MLTKFELELAADLLDMAGDEFGNHGCNDFDVGKYDLTVEEARALDLRVCERIGSIEDHEPDARHMIQSDFCLMLYMGHRLQEEATGDGPTIGRPSEAEEIEKWKTRAIQRRGRVEYLESLIDTLCSKLGITREDAERLVE